MTQVTTSWSRPRVGSRAVEVARLTPSGLTADVAAALGLPPVLFVHGWSMAARPYLPILRRFAAASGREAYAVSMPGFGGSDPLPLRHANVAGFAEHLAKAAAALATWGEHDHFDVAGHSCGGGVSLRLGALRPDLVSSLTLFSPVGGAGDGLTRLDRVAAHIAADALHHWVVPAGLHTVLPNLVRHPLSFAVSGVAAWASSQIHDVHTVAAHGIPTTFLFAHRDEVVTPGPIARVALPGVRVETVPGGHSWLLAEPHRFVETLAERLHAHREERAQGWFAA